PRTTTLAALLILATSIAHAAQLSGIVKDPSGLPVPDAAVTLQAFTTATDDHGRFHFDSVPSGSYTLTVTSAGFTNYQQTVQLTDTPLNLNISLTLEGVATKVIVGASLRNSDPNYGALRSGQPRGVFHVHDLTLQRDVGTLTFRTGSFSFLPPVLGQVTCAVFLGEGNFKLQPAVEIAAQHLKRLSGAETVSEDFKSAILYFTDATYQEIMKVAEAADESP